MVEIPVIKLDTHGPYFKCTDPECYGCMFCTGGLTYCETCGAFEGSWPDECPGKHMSADFADLVYKGIINFRDGNWYGECCQAMRHIHDQDNYMREHGYIRDGINKAGNSKWIRIEEMKSYKDVIKKVPTQHLIDWLARHEKDKETDQFKDYSAELMRRKNND